MANRVVKGMAKVHVMQKFLYRTCWQTLVLLWKTESRRLFCSFPLSINSFFILSYMYGK